MFNLWKLELPNFSDCNTLAFGSIYFKANTQFSEIFDPAHSPYVVIIPGGPVFAPLPDTDADSRHDYSPCVVKFANFQPTSVQIESCLIVGQKHSHVLCVSVCVVSGQFSNHKVFCTK